MATPLLPQQLTDKQLVWELMESSDATTVSQRRVIIDQYAGVCIWKWFSMVTPRPGSLYATKKEALEAALGAILDAT